MMVVSNIKWKFGICEVENIWCKIKDSCSFVWGEQWKIKPPIVFQGGVSKNIGVVKAFESACGENIIVDPNSHLMGALGVAILAKKSNIKKKFSFDIEDINFETKGINCRGCSNNCEIICVSKDKKIIDAWGNRCEKGEVKIHN